MRQQYIKNGCGQADGRAGDAHDLCGAALHFPANDRLESVLDAAAVYLRAGNDDAGFQMFVGAQIKELFPLHRVSARITCSSFVTRGTIRMDARRRAASSSWSLTAFSSQTNTVRLPISGGWGNIRLRKNVVPFERGAFKPIIHGGNVMAQFYSDGVFS